MKGLTLTAATLTLVGAPLAAGPCLPYDVTLSPYASNIAQRVGDLVTIMVEEEAHTEDNGQGELQRQTSLFMKLKQFFLPPIDIQDGLTRAAGSGDPAEIDFQADSQFRARAKNQSNHKFETRIQVRLIEEIRPQEFFVRGYRLVNINGKPKKLFLSGVVRQCDITADNTVKSCQLADAIVEIRGEVGEDDTQPGIIARWWNKVF